MEKLQDWDARSVVILAMEKHRVRSTTSKKMEYQDTKEKLSDFAQSIIEEIMVFTDLGSEDLNLATELTSKPYFSRQWNY
jgi:lipoate-protein ligase A